MSKSSIWADRLILLLPFIL